MRQTHNTSGQPGPLKSIPHLLDAERQRDTQRESKRLKKEQKKKNFFSHCHMWTGQCVFPPSFLPPDKLQLT